MMALFFFSVGLEIKKEMVEGSLASPSKAALPCIAACGGMVVPMMVYMATNLMLPGGSAVGATVPMATDIAFAMGVFGFFRRRMPEAASAFLLALATVDDLGAIAVIAICFAGHIAPRFLLAATGVFIATVLLGQMRRESTKAFIFPSLALWYCLLRGGISADIAGVLVAFCIPMRSSKGTPVLDRLTHNWAMLSAVLILPLFALANCAVPLQVKVAAGTPVAVSMGILLGLLVGKPVGIFGSSYLAIKSGLAPMPPNASNRHLAIMGVLGGIGFTMCLFLIENSMHGAMAQMSKLAVFAASAASAGLGAFFMSRQPIQKTSKGDAMLLA